MSRSKYWCQAMLVAGICTLTFHAAAAQDFLNPAENAYASATADDAAGFPEKIVDRIPIELDDATLADAIDPEAWDVPAAAAKPLTSMGRNAGTTAAWDKVNNGDGSARYKVTKPIAAPWDARIGAEINTAAAPAAPYEPRNLPVTTPNTGSGAAWANVAVPHLATIEVRAEPALDADRVATRVERSVPLGRSLSVTAQTSFGVTELRGPTGQGVSSSPITSSRLFDLDRSMQIDFRTTGTTLLAGATTITGDPITHNRISAVQKIYGPLTVTGSISDLGQPVSNKSITAGVNFAW